jgi:predicted Abi (CAAX) family protease
METTIEPFWNLLGRTFGLEAEVFRQINVLPNGLIVALSCVLAAGLSLAFGQSIILFVNRVTPIRFFFSLLISAVLYVFGFLFLVFSTWLICQVPWSVKISFITLLKVFGLSYAPLLFSFLGALPYFGVPLLRILSIWHLLAMVVGFAAIAGTGLGSAFGYVVFGWLVLQLLQRTIGQPIANLGQWLASSVAGVALTTSKPELLGLIRDRVADISTTWQEELRERIAELQQGNLIGAIAGDPTAGQGISEWVNSKGLVRVTQSKKIRTAKTIFGLLAMALFAFAVVILLRPVREWWFGSYNHWPYLLRLALDLLWILAIAIVIAGLLAPLETLGWWAGWYNDEVDTTLNAGELAEPVDDPKSISRYLVYLDGIGISGFEYLPDIEEFLNELAPTLPDDVALIRGIIPYSVLNNPLNEDRPLAFLWKMAERSRLKNPMSLLGLLVNIRNLIVVGVSADRRYGPLYNLGIAQIVYNGLVKNHYQPRSGTPITLIGYSGGAQMSCACASFLKRALNAPIDVISLGGAIAGNCDILKLEHLYHLVGDKDSVEKIGYTFFPGRWKLFFLSFWNRAKRRGKISQFSLGPVGHQVPGGLLDPDLILNDGRSALKQTIALINAIVRGKLLTAEDFIAVKPSNYELYMQSAFNRPDYYPTVQSPPSELYRPVGTWMGRLILPKLEERSRVRGALFEVYHADEKHQYLVGKIVKLRWSRNVAMQKWIAAVKQDIHFSAEATYTSKHGGLVHPTRLNNWLQVDPLESLAGSRSRDDIVVMLDEPIELTSETIYIHSEPIQITGRFYALVKFVEAIASSDEFRIVHFNLVSGEFDGKEEVISLPEVVFAQAYGSYPSTIRDLEKSPYNETGWYIYGDRDSKGVFIVRSLGPRALFRLQPDEIVFGAKASYDYIRKRSWADIAKQKGRISSVLCASIEDESPDEINRWQEGDRALVLHVYGGIGGNRSEPSAQTPIFFGHFAFGLAKVVREPLGNELRFDLRYYQVYTHNTDGLISGILHWSRYLGDRQFGWLGTRPVCDILIKHDAFTEDYDFDGKVRSPLNLMLMQLQVMAARYRTGDGTGGTYVGPVNNCSQDSGQALLACLQQIERQVKEQKTLLQEWSAENSERAQRLKQLLRLGKALKQKLLPLGGSRFDGDGNEYILGSTLEDEPLRNLIVGLASWRTMFPRLASDTIVKIFLDRGASVWVLRTNQIGGCDRDIEPIAHMTI